MVTEFGVNKASIFFSVVHHCFQALLLLTFLLFAYQKKFVLDEHDGSLSFMKPFLSSIFLNTKWSLMLKWAIDKLRLIQRN